MILILLLVLCVLAAPEATAQPDWVAAASQATPSFGIHREAVSLTLIDDVILTFSKDGNALIRSRIAHRILRPGGTEVATVTIPTSPNCALNRLKGWLLSKGKEKETVDEGDAIISNPHATAGYYSDARESAVTLPGAQPGDVVAYEYELEESGPTARYQSNQFQGRQPVLRSTYSVTIPDGWSIRTDGRRLERVTSVTTGNTTVWSAADLPYEPDEPLTPPSHQAGRSLRLIAIGGEEGSFAGWEDVARWERLRTEPAVTPDGAISAAATSVMAGDPSNASRIMAAARFVQQEIRYVALELGEGGWTPRPAGETLQNRFGDCKDKATLLRAILRTAGIPSAAVLASTDARVSTELPSPFQFNHLIIGIPDSVVGAETRFRSATAGGWFFFDPTDPTVPPGKLPPALEGSRVFVAGAGETSPIRLPRAGAAGNRSRTDAEGVVAHDGSISVTVRMAVTGKPAYALRGILSATSDPTRLWLSYVGDAIPGAVVKSAAVVDSLDSLLVTMTVSGHGLLSSSGAGGMFQPNFLRRENFDRLTARTRTNPLWLGPPSSEEIRIRWSYDQYLAGPDTFLHMSRACAGNAFTSEIRSHRKGLEFRYDATRSDDVIPAAEYGSVRMYLAEMDQAATMSVQLRSTLR